MQVELVRAAATYGLRQAVLRPSETVDAQALEDDDGPETATFAVRDAAGAVIACGRVAPASAPPVLESVALSWQLRAMAVEPAHRGTGIGTAVLDRAIAHVAAHGGGMLWCNARLPARSLYRRAGFVEIGGIFLAAGAVEHVVMWRDVDAHG